MLIEDCLARSSEDDGLDLSPQLERESSVAATGVKMHSTQSQYPDAISPFQQGWAFAGSQGSPRDDRHSQMEISPEGVAESNMHVHANSSPSQAYQDSRHRSNSTLANSMMRTVVASGNDALNILFEAATAHQDDNSMEESSPAMGVPSRNDASRPKERSTPRNFESPTGFESVPRSICAVNISEVTQDVLQVWEACRFVRMGWFTAKEAVTFIDL